MTAGRLCPCEQEQLERLARLSGLADDEDEEGDEDDEEEAGGEEAEEAGGQRRGARGGSGLRRGAQVPLPDDPGEVRRLVDDLQRKQQADRCVAVQHGAGREEGGGSVRCCAVVFAAVGRAQVGSMSVRCM